jgi:poly(3-hydroxybutyrate) depolymerase
LFEGFDNYIERGAGRHFFAAIRCRWRCERACRWSARRHERHGWSHCAKNIDDVAFARALVAKLQTQACIDPKRIYAVGYSLGGGMSIKLACDAADLFAAVAPAAFDLMIEEQWPC